MKNTEELQCCVTTCGLPLNANYWDKQYQNNETGWDLHQVSPPIKSYIDGLSDKHMHILIPGCGNAYEAEYLVQQGFKNVTVIDISSTLVASLKEKFKNDSIRVLHGDFFEHQEKYDLILEQTFFCALNPSLRERYAVKCFELLNEGGKIAGLLFNIIFEKEGPPFGGTKEEYVRLFEPIYDLQQFDTCNNSVKPRAGNELFIEMSRKKMPSDFVKLYGISGITCSGCKNSITENLLKVDGVVMVSINSDFSEVMAVSSKSVALTVLKQAIAHETKYQLTELKK
ncbi:MAG: methyltransferase domain-containing protein [Chitinophagales bacterium]|nr:methyltransferase domain-containing protein [Chitinophagales bacterium]